MKPDLIVADDHEQASALAAAAVAEKKPSTLGLSGGETPGLAYQLLSKTGLTWDSMKVFLVDERWVPPDHPASNLLLVRRTLADATGVEVRGVDTSLPPEAASADYARVLAEGWPLDMAVMGIGSDGHTASLFPQGPEPRDDEPLAVTTWSRATGTWRISMSYRALSATKDIIFLVTGSEKKQALSRMLRGDDIPAARISGRESLVVIADRAAHP